MGKLFQLKEWLTIPEAAKHLSGVFEEDVTEADVLRLSLDGRMKLSVNLVNRCVAKGGKIVPVSEARKAQSLDDPARFVILGIPLSLEEILELYPGVIYLAGVWDLPMFGGEQLEIENRYQQLTGGPEVSSIDFNGVFLGSREVGIFQVLAEFADSSESRDRPKEKRSFDPERYYPSSGLPDDTVLVVRTEALRDFEQSLRGGPSGATKVSDNTLTATIAALLAAWPGGKPPSGKDLEKAAASVGVSVSDDSIRKALKLAQEIAPSLKSA